MVHKIIKYFLRTVSGLVVLLLLLCALCYVPFIQDFIRERIVSSVESSMGWHISVGTVRLSFPLGVRIKSVQVFSSDSDTLLSLESFEAKAELLPLLGGEIALKKASLQGLEAAFYQTLPSMDIVGHLKDLQIDDVRVSLSGKVGEVGRLSLSDTDLALALRSVEKSDSAESAPLPWSFHIKDVRLDNTAFAFSMLPDYLALSTAIKSFRLTDSDINLSDNTFQVAHISLSHGRFAMQMDSLDSSHSGFDFRHIDLQNINIEADSLYNQKDKVKALIKNVTAVSAPDFQLKDFSGIYEMDSAMLRISDMKLNTLQSYLKADIFADMSLFDSIPSGRLDAEVDAVLGYGDVLYFTENFSSGIENCYPHNPLVVNVKAAGNSEHLEIDRLRFWLSGSFDVDGKGYVKGLSDIRNSTADMKLQAEFSDMDFLGCLMGKTQTPLSIPHNTSLEATLRAAAGNYKADMTYLDSHPVISFKAECNPALESYDMQLQTDSLYLDRYLPSIGVKLAQIRVNAKGRGFDPMHKSAQSQIELDMKHLVYDRYDIKDVLLNARLDTSHYQVVINGADSVLLLNLTTKGILSRKLVTGNLNYDIRNIDFQKLNFSDTPLSIASSLQADFSTDMQSDYFLKLEACNILLKEDSKDYRLGSLGVDVGIDADSTRLDVKSGDMEMLFKTGDGIDSLVNDMKLFTQEAIHQFNARKISVDTLFAFLPSFFVQASAGTQNLAYGYLKGHGIQFKNVNVTALNNNRQGFLFNTSVVGLQKDSTYISQMTFDLHQEDEVASYYLAADMPAEHYRRERRIVLDGEFSESRLSARLLQKNGHAEPVFDVEALAWINPDSVSVSFATAPVLLTRPWSINPGNYISLVRDSIIHSDFILTAEGGMSLALTTAPAEVMQGSTALDLKISALNLGRLSQAFPDQPPFSGFISSDLHIEMLPDWLHVNGDALFSEIYFNRKRLGNVDLALNLGSKSTQGNVGSAVMKLDGREILSSRILLSKVDSIGLRSQTRFTAFPLNLADPFIPEALASFKGNLSGNMTVNGSLARPVVNATLDLDSAAVYLTYADATYSLDETPVNIINSRLRLNRYKIYAYNKNPLSINGYYDFADFDKMSMDFRFTGTNVELLNVKKQNNQLVFGKMLMNVDTSVKGSPEIMNIRGSVNLLDGTDITYIMRDSPVSAQNRVDNLVEFTSFRDTIDTDYEFSKKKMTISGLDVLMNIGIADNVQMAIDLSESGDDKVVLRGGGDLAFKMSFMGETDLSGRYNLNGGYVRYNLPVLPVAKTFDIRNGSYVEWNGKLMDPYIDIIAYERIRTTVTEESKGSRVVNFDAMILVRNRLENLDVSFTVEAPDDPTIQSQIATMTAEERSRQAMNLLITKSYTGAGVSTSGMTTNSALNSFIQKEINQFASKTLKGVDLSVGIDELDNTSGQSRTDYSFKFSKQFFNDRFRLVLGGKVSSGEQSAENAESSFLQDVSVEYNLDQTGNRYLKLFHHTGYESVLEGEVVETGVGIVLKRKVRKLRQLFIFSEKKRQQAIDSIQKIEDNVIPLELPQSEPIIKESEIQTDAK